MSFSLIEICNDCGWSTDELVVAACVATATGIALGLVRYWLWA